MRLNEIDKRDIEAQIGSDSFDRASRLCRWLFGESVLHLYRVAPSPITRSEAELFSVCAPRFCYRKYVYERQDIDPQGDWPENLGFINLRRLAWFRKSVNRLGTSPNPILDDEIQNGGCGVADSLLVVPRDLDAYQTLNCDLWHYYGEPERSINGAEPRRSAVPFIHHISLGGGMCAQACLFMSLCLLKPHNKRIPSISEITVLSSLAKISDRSTIKETKNKSFSVRTGGMSPAPMTAFLKQECGLAAFLEAELPGTGYLSEVGATAIEGYIQSGYPVICLVSLGRLSGLKLDDEKRGTSVYHSNKIYGESGYIRSDKCELPDRENHGVVVVGVDSMDPHRFLINDPASVPFLTASYQQLNESRSYKDIKTGELTEKLSFISMLPGDCQLPLVCRNAKQPNLNDSLFSIASTLYGHGIYPGAASDVMSKWKEAWPGSVRLFDGRPGTELDDARETILKKWFKDLTNSVNDSETQYFQKMMTVLHHKIIHVQGTHKFVWVHRLTFPEAETSKLFVWAADKHPHDGSIDQNATVKLARLVLGVFSINHKTFQTTQLKP